MTPLPRRTTFRFWLCLRTALLFLAAAALPASAQAPDGVRVTNVAAGSFTVAWTTAAAAPGSIRLGTSPTALSTLAADPRGAGTTHSVTAGSLEPSTTYYLDVYTGDARDDNSGNHYKVTTGPRLAPRQPAVIYGRAVRAGGTSPAGILVFAQVIDADGAGSPGRSAPLSYVILESDQGYWSINLDWARTQDLSAAFVQSPADTVHLQLVGGPGQVAEATITIASAAPAAPLTVPQAPAATATAQPAVLPPTATAALPSATPAAAAPTSAPAAQPTQSRTATPASQAAAPSPTVTSLVTPTSVSASPTAQPPAPGTAAATPQAPPAPAPMPSPASSVALPVVALPATTAPAPTATATPPTAAAVADDWAWLLLVIGLAGTLLLVGALLVVLVGRYRAH